MRTGFLTLVYGLMLSFSALATPFDNITTHNVAVPEQSFQLAATWFLPDWQASSSTRTDSAPSGSGDRHDLSCSTYGGCEGNPANMTCSESFSAGGLTCYKSCTCKSGYNRADSSDICKGCANPCDTVTAVATPYGCQTAWSVCPSKCQVAYPDNCRNRNAVSTPYGCKNAFADCSSKCQTAYADNCHNRTAVPTPYGCKASFADCSYKCETAYADNCHNRSDNKTDLGCEKTWEDCASKCETGKTCTAKDCSAFTLTSVPDNANYSSCTPGCGNTVAKYRLDSCKTNYRLKGGVCVSDICVVGSKTSCTGSQIQTGTTQTDYGTTCYSCRAITCRDVLKTQGLNIIENQQDFEVYKDNTETTTLYVNGPVTVNKSIFELNNLVFEDAAKISDLCSAGSLALYSGFKLVKSTVFNIPVSGSAITLTSGSANITSTSDFKFITVTAQGGRMGLNFQKAGQVEIKSLNVSLGDINLIGMVNSKFESVSPTDDYPIKVELVTISEGGKFTASNGMAIGALMFTNSISKRAASANLSGNIMTYINNSLPKDPAFIFGFDCTYGCEVNFPSTRSLNTIDLRGRTLALLSGDLDIDLERTTMSNVGGKFSFMSVPVGSDFSIYTRMSTFGFVSGKMLSSSGVQCKIEVANQTKMVHLDQNTISNYMNANCKWK